MRSHPFTLCYPEWVDQLSLPLGIQSIISFVLGGMSTSLVILIFLVVLGVFFSGMLQVKPNAPHIEKVQQKIFVRYAFEVYRKDTQAEPISAIDGEIPSEVVVNRF